MNWKQQNANLSAQLTKAHAAERVAVSRAASLLEVISDMDLMRCEREQWRLKARELAKECKALKTALTKLKRKRQ